jgi:hypothetical protein
MTISTNNLSNRLGMAQATTMAQQWHRTTVAQPAIGSERQAGS